MVSQRASQPKVIESSPEEEVEELESSDEEEQEWEARAILDEKTIPNPDYRKQRSSSHSSRYKAAVPPTIIQYLIDWEGVDDSGKPWDSSWENGDGATQGLVDDWERRKKEDPDIVGRYTREQEEKRRKSRRKSSDKKSDSQRKESSRREAAGSGSKADASSGAAPPESPSGPAEKDEPQQPVGSPSPAKSTLSDRPIRSSQISKRKVVLSPPTTTSSGKRTQVDSVAASDKGDSSSKRESRGKFASSEGSKRRDDRLQGKRRETVVGDSISRLQDRERQTSTSSPKSTEHDTGSRKRRKVLDADDEADSPTITARTTSSRTGSTVRDDDRRQAKKQKTGRDKPDQQSSRRNDKGSRTSGANEGTKSTPRNPGPGETLKAIRAQRALSKPKDTDALVATPDTSSARKKKQKPAEEPPTCEAKEAWKRTVTFNHSQSTTSPSIVGDSQPPLLSSGESRASQRTPSQRTPPDLAQSTDVRRLAISGAMTQASLGSPERPGQDLPPPLVNAEAGPSTKTEPPAAAPMEVDQEFIPNSLFAMEDDGGSDHESPDMPQSQAVALQRAIDLLMMEENFLEEEKSKDGQTPEPTTAEPSTIPEKQVHVDLQREVRIDSVDPAVSDHSTATARAKEPSKRAPRKPFSAVDDFVAPAPPAPSAKQAQSTPAEAAAVKQHNVPKELHPIPHLAPSVFRNVGISGTPESFMNTQADSIHDFESPHRDVRVPETTVGRTSEAVVTAGEKVAAVDAAVQTEVTVEQTTTEVMILDEEPPATMDDEEESQLPELGEDDWSRILDSATINPSILGKPPGIPDNDDMTSSEETSHRSDENLPPRPVVENGALLEVQAKIQALESDLAKVQSEKQQLEEHVDTLKADLQDATTSYQNSQSQFSLIQDLYNQASATTMRLSRENEELEEEAERLRRQVDTGLKQKDLFIQSFVDAKDREIAELQARNDMLLQQVERTETIRVQLVELRQVKADLKYAEAQMAVCAECNRRTTQTSNDSDPEYRPLKMIVPDNNDRSTRSRAKAREEPVQAKVVEQPVVHKPILHAPVQRPESEAARKKLPLTDLARWAHDRDIRSLPESSQEVNLGADVANVDMVHICRWRPKHGNVCSALFANVEDLAHHTLGHLSNDPADSAVAI